MKCLKCGNEYEGNFCPNCGNAQGDTRTTNVPNATTPQIIINNTNTVSSTIGVSSKNKIVALILAIFFGCLGVHRFYVGKIGTGVIWLFTAGFFMIGWIYDIIKIATGTFRDGAGLVIR
jgi:TM2 domain-containing membrane protein YozV